MPSLTLSQLQARDRLVAQNTSSGLAGIEWFVGLVGLSERFVLLVKCGDVNARRRVSEFEFNQAKFKLLDEEAK